MPVLNSREVGRVLDFIRNHWMACLRETPADTGTLIGLPFPYIVPSVKDAFQEIYYWDAYFTNLGLIAQGLPRLARANTDNLLHLMDRFGFVPNGNRTFYLRNSQPPYLAMMVRDVQAALPDRSWLDRARQVLEREYAFWMTRRLAPTGLNRYGSNVTDAGEHRRLYREFTDRLRLETPGGDAPEKVEAWAVHFTAGAESGWDFTPRFDLRCADWNPVDLNSNLYVYERLLAEFCETCGAGNPAAWRRRAEQRKTLMNRFCWDEERGVFVDYDFRRDCLNPMVTAASWHPLWAGLASAGQASASRRGLAGLEAEYGIVTCPRGPRATAFQWDYPNGWAPLQWVAIAGLLRYGFRADALRLAEKYLALVTRVFRRTGGLWEKYNVANGSIEVRNEYAMPELLDWTAGVFVAAAALCRKGLNKRGA
ncbi:MAG: alpha,alpha-trehalase [Lentisphaerae bacterium]|nr:alpha,alpha-trehalase [Lentisphaerota bacterium]